MKKILLSLCIACLVALIPIAGKATTGIGIAAIVNDDIISTLDLENRVHLVIGTTGLSNTPEVQANLRPQILRSLIDEKLQLQEATRNGITVSDKDMEAATATIEKQNNQPPGSFDDFLARKGLPKLPFMEQMKAQIAWSKLLSKKIRGKIKISDTEVLQSRARFAGKQKGDSSASEVQISAISLPVYTPGNDANALKLANKLSKEIHGGASFDAVAAQFTGEGADATNSGAIWVPVNQLDPAVMKAISTMAAGQVTEPVRTASGYQIIKLLDSRKAAPASTSDTDEELALKQIVLTLKPDAGNKEVDVLMQIAKLVAKNPGSCADSGIAGVDAKSMEDANIDVKMSHVRLSALSPDMQPIVGKLSVGEVSEPFATSQGIHLLMLCERVDIPATYVNKDSVREALFQEKAGLEAAKYMRNLRREAFVDIRL